MKYQIKIKGIVAICISALLLIIIGAGWFYWYEWRPTQIRKECSKICQGLEFLGRNCKIEIEYQNCLYERGINK